MHYSCLRQPNHELEKKASFHLKRRFVLQKEILAWGFTSIEHSAIQTWVLPSVENIPMLCCLIQYGWYISSSLEAYYLSLGMCIPLLMSFSQSKNAVCASQTNCKLLTFPLEKSCRNEQTVIFFHNKGSIYYIKHGQIQLFDMRVGWSENICLMEVSVMIYKCTYYVFTFYGRWNLTT